MSRALILLLLFLNSLCLLLVLDTQFYWSTYLSRPPQPGEHWANASPDPSPWATPPVVYTVCEVKAGYVCYVFTANETSCQGPYSHHQTVSSFMYANRRKTTE